MSLTPSPDGTTARDRTRPRLLTLVDLAATAVFAIGGAQAGGLSLFCVVGAAKALDHDLRPVAAVLLGTITAVGGGVIRDVLVDVVPSVLRADVYATAAVIGSAVVVALSACRVRRPRAMLVGAVACFVVRMMSLWFDWELPRAIGR